MYLFAIIFHLYFDLIPFLQPRSCRHPIVLDHHHCLLEAERAEPRNEVHEAAAGQRRQGNDEHVGGVLPDGSRNGLRGRSYPDDQGYVSSVVYSGGGPSIPVSYYPPAGAQYPSIPLNFERLFLGCIEADLCK